MQTKNKAASVKTRPESSVHRLIFSSRERGLRIWLDKKLILVLNDVLRDLQYSKMTQ